MVQSLIQEVTTFLSDDHTPVEVRDQIINGIKRWLIVESDSQPTPLGNLLVNEAYERQTEIGWDHFIRGRIGTQWKGFIQQHINNKQQMPNPYTKKAKNTT
jgi:hypothetical protein